MVLLKKHEQLYREDSRMKKKLIKDVVVLEAVVQTCPVQDACMEVQVHSQILLCSLLDNDTNNTCKILSQDVSTGKVIHQYNYEYWYSLTQWLLI